MNDFLYPIVLKKFEEIHSTNDYLKENKIKNWTFIWSKYQSKGRGQKGNWEAERGKNLTFSFYLIPDKLKTIDFFLLNIFICNALHKTLHPYSKYLFIKWPNDILLKDKKIAGVLIENSISKEILKSSIIGIGINVNQINFSGFEKASSLKKELGIEFNLEKLLKELIKNIQQEYILLKELKKETLKEYYLNHLYKKGELCSFDHKGKMIKARLMGIDSQGKLLLKFEREEENLKSFEQKEISLIY